MHCRASWGLAMHFGGASQQAQNQQSSQTKLTEALNAGETALASRLRCLVPGMLTAAAPEKATLPRAGRWQPQTLKLA